MLSVEQIKELRGKGELWRFYHDKAWVRLSKQVRAEQNNECWFCRKRGKYSPAELVHHIRELKEYPQYAYSRYVTGWDGVDRVNLVAVCRSCHEHIHGRSAGGNVRHFTNTERW